MSEFTRLTVRGASRRAEIAVSSDDPLGTMLPQLIDALSEPIGAVTRPLALLTSVGEPLDLERSARELGVLDGSALRLLPFDSAPPPPLVIDVVDVVADEFDSRPDRWNDRARGVVTGALIALAAATASAAVPLAAAPGFVARVVLVGILLAAATGFGLSGVRRLARAFTVAAAGAVVPCAVHGAALAGDVFVTGNAALAGSAALADSDALAGAAAVAGASFTATSVALAGAVVLLLGVGVAQRSRGAVAGGALGIALTVALLLLLAVGVPPAQSAAVVGVLGALLVGVVPWIALSVSGLTGLDERAAAQGALPRSAALDSVGEAYRSLTWSVAALAACATICGVMLWTTGTVWSMLLAVALAAVLVLRSRAFPLRSHGLLLWGSAVSVVLCAAATALAQSALAHTVLAETAPGWGLVGAAVAGGCVAAIAGMASPRPHQRARLRALGDLVEAGLVVALMPLAVGVFGIYAEMLALFGDGA